MELFLSHYKPNTRKPIEKREDGVPGQRHETGVAKILQANGSSLDRFPDLGEKEPCAKHSSGSERAF